MPDLEPREAAWGGLEAFLGSQLVRADAVLDDVLARCEAEGLPPIQVSPLQAQLLHLMVRSAGARRVLEIGTLGGYSTVWFARAVGPDGHVHTVELDAHHRDVALRNLDAAGVSAMVHSELGTGADCVRRLVDEGAAPFDVVFLDVGRAVNTELLPMVLELSRPGTLLVVSAKDLLRETRGMVAFVGEHPHLAATAVQTVGSDGMQGFLVMLVGDPGR